MLSLGGAPPHPSVLPSLKWQILESLSGDLACTLGSRGTA